MPEAWLNGKLEGYAPLMMPAAHALVECAKDLRRHSSDLTVQDLTARPNAAASVAFHLKHIAGSIDRLLTYVKDAQLDERQFDELKGEAEETTETAAQLVEKTCAKIEEALAALKSAAPETLFEPRFVGRKKLETTVFGLLFHIAEHTARHTGQIVTTAKIVRQKG